jgi:hypothetical protein
LHERNLCLDDGNLRHLRETYVLAVGKRGNSQDHNKKNHSKQNQMFFLKIGQTPFFYTRWERFVCLRGKKKELTTESKPDASFHPGKNNRPSLSPFWYTDNNS